MKLTVESPSVELNTIKFRLVGRPDLSGLDDLQGPLTLEVKKKGRKRSLDANAYCWVLLDKLSEVMQVPPAELYRNAIREVGGVSEIVPLRNDAIPMWIKNWSRNGVGWMCDVLDACKKEGYTHVKCYYGSSTYDTRQMSRLIDGIVQDCQAVGIETDTGYINSLLEAWDGKV